MLLWAAASLFAFVLWYRWAMRAFREAGIALDGFYSAAGPGSLLAVHRYRQRLRRGKLILYSGLVIHTSVLASFGVMFAPACWADYRGHSERPSSAGRILGE